MKNPQNHKKHILFYLAGIFCVFYSNAYSQSTTGTLTGIVKSADNQPAEFVTVFLKGTNKGAQTNNKGEYSIQKVNPGNYTLVISYVGLEPVEKTAEVRAGETTYVKEIILSQNARELKEVVITGNQNSYNNQNPSNSLRLQSPLIEVPQNIQVVTKEVLQQQQSIDMLENVTRNVSGAQKLEHWDNYARINMRGSQITAFRNGMNVQMPWGPLTEDLSMVERVEFVKGPAGFMLSSGEPSGFYNVVTKKPSGINKGEVSFTLGSFNLYRATTDMDGKLREDGKLLYRLNVMGQMKGSHRDFEYNNRYSIAPVIKYIHNEKTAVTLEYTHQFSEMSVVGSNYAFSRNGYGDLPRNFTTAEANLAPSRINDRSVLAMFEHHLNEGWKLTAQAGYFNYQALGQSLWPWKINITNDSFMQRGISIWDALGENKNAQVFLNGRVNTFGITHNILAGLDMRQQDYFADWNQGAALGDSVFNIYNPVYGTVAAKDIPLWDRSRNIRERGVHYGNGYSSMYLQDEIGFFGNKLRITLAGRYTHLKNGNVYSGFTDDAKFTPRTGLSFSFTEAFSAYALYDEAFMGNPGMDYRRNSFDPLTGTNIEAGVKKDFFGHRLSTTVSAFQITKNNVLTTDLENADPVTGQFVFSRQSGQTQAQGIEADVKGQILPSLSIIVNYAYTENQITKDSDPRLIGQPIAGATKHIQNTWLNYRLRNGKLNGFGLSLGYQYQSGRSTWGTFDDSKNALPDYFRLDGGISYSKNSFSINLLINNILDEYLYSGATYGNMFYWQTEPGRNARLTIAHKF